MKLLARLLLEENLQKSVQGLKSAYDRVQRELSRVDPLTWGGHPWGNYENPWIFFQPKIRKALEPCLVDQLQTSRLVHPTQTFKRMKSF